MKSKKEKRKLQNSKSILKVMCRNVLLQEMHRFYNVKCDGRSSSLPALSVSVFLICSSHLSIAYP